MITPEEQVEILIEKFTDSGAFTCAGDIRSDKYKRYKAIQNALILCDTILNTFGLTCDGKEFYTSYNTIEYFIKVKLILKDELELC